jgi:hypothetical protein
MSAVLRACRTGRKTGKEAGMFDGLLLLLPTSFQAFFPGAKASEKLKEIASGNARNTDVGQRDAEEVVEVAGGGRVQGSAALAPSREVGDGPEEDEKQEEEDQEQQEHPDQEQQQESQQEQQEQQHQREHLPAKQVERSSRSIKRSTVESVKSVAGGLGMITLMKFMLIITFLMQLQGLTDLIVSS